MATRTTNGTIKGFPFYQYLKLFFDQNKKRIYSEFKPLTKKFLNYNNKRENADAYLRLPQFEALEVYVFLKEFCHNKQMWEIFKEWYDKTGVFEGRLTAGIDMKGQMSMFGPDEFHDEVTKEQFKKVFEEIKNIAQIYPNYIFALTMGLGKTTLMATCIFYEFLLANKFKKNEQYCHNVLVFAPDKTVLDSLHEIITLDKSKVVPPEYVSFLDTNIKTHFLDESGGTLNTLDGSDFNIIISNTQKIILKRQHKETTPVADLFGASTGHYRALSMQRWADIQAEAGIEDVDNEADLMLNGRFVKLLRLKQLGVYVDEAHHVFGNDLKKALIPSCATSLRVTINELAEQLKLAGSNLVGCYNYTGTPYVQRSLLPEVVYAYGLKDAIDNGYLKKAEPHGYSNVREDTQTFCNAAVQHFWEKCGEKRVEGMLPKLAFYASSIEELMTELKPAVEHAMQRAGIQNISRKILVNVGDESITRNDDIREFKTLDTPKSEKQFILLVNKGKEGWNCRSLFGVALHREPKSHVFVLQAAMRCLRQIGEVQHVGYLYLSDENVTILNEELQNNFNVKLQDIQPTGEEGEILEVRPVPPSVEIEVSRTKKMYNLVEKTPAEHVDFESKSYDLAKYKIIDSVRDVKDLSKKVGPDVDRTDAKEKRAYSPYTLTAEIARYLFVSPLLINKILENSVEGIDSLCELANEYNELVYDEIIPRIFKELYDTEEYTHKVPENLKLVIEPKDGYYQFRPKPDMVMNIEENSKYKDYSFNLDNYVFDSSPEKVLFMRLLSMKDKLNHVWFTGMLGNSQTEFKVYYIDPESKGIRAYYPDFLIETKDGKYMILEVKGEHMIDSDVVQAKKRYAEEMAEASKMEYVLIPSQQVNTFHII